MYESQGRHKEAAREWLKLGQDEKALENWEKAGDYEEIGRYHLSRKQYEKAAAGFEKAERYEDAASCYKKAKKFAKAADLYFRAEDYKNAAILYKKLKRTDNLLQCHLAMEDDYSAALIYERNKDVEKAIEYFKRFSGACRENADFLRLEASKHSSRHMTLKAALRYSALSMYEVSAPFYLRKGYVDRAIEEYRALGDQARLAECLEKQGRFYEAAVQVEQEDTQDKWDKVTRLLQNHLHEKQTAGLYGYRDIDKKRAEMLYQEGEACLRAGSCEKALARFRAIHYPEGILRAFLKLNRDEDAVRFFTNNNWGEYAERYLQEKEDADLSLDLLKELTEEYSRVNIRYYRGSRQDLDFLARAFASRLKKHGDDETRFLLDDYLAEFEYHHEFEDLIPASLLDLALESRGYNAIFRAAAAQKYGRDRISDKIRSFFDSVKAEADDHADRNLLASYCFLYDVPAYELILKDLCLTPRNYRLFSESRLHYRKTVDYLLDKRRTEEAAVLCRRHRDLSDAARIYEEQGDFISAGRDYREAKQYEDALRCYGEAKDAPNVARVYERMNDFQKATKIWAELGRPREVMRIQKKLARIREKASQPRLL